MMILKINSQIVENEKKEKYSNKLQFIFLSLLFVPRNWERIFFLKKKGQESLFLRKKAKYLFSYGSSNYFDYWHMLYLMRFHDAGFIAMYATLASRDVVCL